MKKKTDLTQGNIFKTLAKLIVPVIATSLFQMAYGMTDMIWIGKVGSSAVAAIGTAGFITWFGFSILLVAKIGAEIGVAQSTGKKDSKSANDFARNSIYLNIVIAIMFFIIIIIFKKPLIEFYKIKDVEVVKMAISYITIFSFSSLFMFINPVLSGIYNGTGDSKTPFYINSVGLIINTLLDPILIFGLGPIPKMGVEGAAIASVFAQMVVTIIFIFYFTSNKNPLNNFNLFNLPSFKVLKKIFKFGSPIAIYSSLFTIFAIFIAKIIAKWGPIPIAVQKIGIQIEAISYMTASGFSTALSAFVGQNFGAEKWNRIWKGFFISLGSMSIFGIIISLLLILMPRQIFMIFIKEEETVRLGVVYLRILGISQLFMCWEIMVLGAFNGIGKTIPPSFIGIIFTGLRLPSALILSSTALLGLNGVWWSISISSILTGVILVIWFIILLHKHPAISSRELIKESIFRWNIRYFRDKKSLTGRN